MGVASRYNAIMKNGIGISPLYPVMIFLAPDEYSIIRLYCDHIEVDHDCLTITESSGIIVIGKYCPKVKFTSTKTHVQSPPPLAKPKH